MRVAIGHGLHAAPWADDRPGAHVVRAAKTSVWTAEPGHICPISMTYAVVPALRYNPELAARLRAAADQPRIRPRAQGAADQGRHHRGHVDDREAGRLRRPRRHHAGHPQRRRQLQPDRAQVVHLGADVRRLPGARAGAGRAALLLPAAGAARRHPQPDVPAAAQGQARQPRQRLERGRVRRRHRVAGRRGGPRRADHHRDGQPHPAGLHAGQRDQHAHRSDPRHPPRPAPKGVRRVPDRPAADAQRAGRPRRRGRGRHDGRDADGRRHRQRGARRRDARRCCAGSDWRPASTGCASAPPRTPRRRWNAWAATATSRSPACRGCTARRR